MHLLKKFHKLFLILLLTVGVVCSCCSCATTKATSIKDAGKLITAVEQKKILNDSITVLNTTLENGVICEQSYMVCKSYSSWLDSHLSENVITRYEWLEILFDTLHIEPMYGLDYHYYRFMDKDFFDGREYFMTAIEKEILGPGGREFDPNCVASRQYVSTTLVNAAGYSKNDKLACNDIKTVKDKKQAAVTLKLGYLNLDENNNFNPYKAITAQEVQYIKGELELLFKLKGKTIMTFGDSIMHGDGNFGVGIADLLSQRYMMRGIDYSKGGSTFGYTQNRQQISNQILNAIRDNRGADVILINGGTNDMHKVKCGSISEDYLYGTHGRLEYASGMEYALGLLQDNFPNIPVVYIRAHDMVYANEANEIYYGNLALKICEKWKVNTIDMYNDSDFDGHNDEIKSKYTTYTKYCPSGDTVHPNKDGYLRFYLPPITEAIVDLCKN